MFARFKRQRQEKLKIGWQRAVHLSKRAFICFKGGDRYTDDSEYALSSMRFHRAFEIETVKSSG